jgi:hypothetical protein
MSLRRPAKAAIVTAMHFPHELMLLTICGWMRIIGPIYARLGRLLAIPARWSLASGGLLLPSLLRARLPDTWRVESYLATSAPPEQAAADTSAGTGGKRRTSRPGRLGTSWDISGDVSERARVRFSYVKGWVGCSGWWVGCGGGVS